MGGESDGQEPTAEESAENKHTIPTNASLHSREITILGVEFSFITQRLAESVDWSFSRKQHTILVWRRGRASSKEIQFQGGFAGRMTPRDGNVWVIPAELSSAALVRNAAFEFAQLTLPPRSVVGTTLRPVADHQDPLLHNMVDRIAGLTERQDVLSRLLRDSIAEGLRLHVRDRYGETPSPDSKSVQMLDQGQQRRLMEFLHDSLDERIDLRTAANIVGMSVHDFRPAFAQAFNTTLYQFVLDQRIQRAKVLLASTPLTMTEISFAVGFSSPSHFATTFKQRVGVTPSTYRAST
ncbi:helix-turn-helix transcriptional regulator [Mycolicibacterium porcinum]|uniref:helix-turn-helix transcriptional regulator n=1 Tax=Mycolicibacterium porcinum TaxID=39693 RepID=UPI0009F3408E|nr:AraC family transcriptional regulator [Mycolicibacterium porcinum]